MRDETMIRHRTGRMALAGMDLRIGTTSDRTARARVEGRAKGCKTEREVLKSACADPY
jgi:hypothetical protein